MKARPRRFAGVLALAVALLQVGARPASGQDPPAHPMARLSPGGGWRVVGMGQAFPVSTTGWSRAPDGPLDRSGWYLTQPVAMVNLESPGSRLSLRVTPNLEGVTQEEGELSYGGWGEGFLDKRHPHTLVHELMVSVNGWDVAGGDLSLSAGKGFAPYGTDDPMSRPVLKYPTNHHLSQILERWTVNGAFLREGWSVEAGIFGGAEPEGPYDMSNIESFGDSWSVRLAGRFGDLPEGGRPWEVSASTARVTEDHDGGSETTALYNLALRHDRARPFGRTYGLVEWSWSDPDGHEGYWSVLAEAAVDGGRHRPYARVEYATRPEFDREGPPGTDRFFRYEHEAEPVGATRWLITTVGYGYRLTDLPVSARPFVELSHHRIREERGEVVPRDLFGAGSAWSLSAGLRIFLGGDPMRMGAYGVLDPMTRMERGAARAGGHGHGEHSHTGARDPRSR